MVNNTKKTLLILQQFNIEIIYPDEYYQTYEDVFIDSATMI